VTILCHHALGGPDSISIFDRLRSIIRKRLTSPRLKTSLNLRRPRPGYSCAGSFCCPQPASWFR
jgi:hypothetical protein